MGASEREKGARAEQAVVRALVQSGFARARRVLAGDGRQPGDVAGLPGWTIEVKDQARDALGRWVDQAKAESAGRGYSAVWHKRRGRTDAKDWFVTMSAYQFIDLLIEIGMLEDPWPPGIPYNGSGGD